MKQPLPLKEAKTKKAIRPVNKIYFVFHPGILNKKYKHQEKNKYKEDLLILISMPLTLYEEDEYQTTGQLSKQHCFSCLKEKQNNIPTIHSPGGAIDLLYDNQFHSNQRPGIL